MRQSFNVEGLMLLHYAGSQREKEAQQRCRWTGAMKKEFHEAIEISGGFRPCNPQEHLGYHDLPPLPFCYPSDSEYYIRMFRQKLFGKTVLLAHSQKQNVFSSAQAALENILESFAWSASMRPQAQRDLMFGLLDRGRSKIDIADILGISRMRSHRWQKAGRCQIPKRGPRLGKRRLNTQQEQAQVCRVR